MLNVTLTGHGSGFQQMLNQARIDAKAFSNAVTHDISKSWADVGKSLRAGLAGFFTYQGISSIIGAVTNKVGELRELSEQLGTDDVEKIQKWGKAFEKVGGSVSKLTMLTSQMTEKRNAAMGHDLEAIKARQELEGFGFTKDEINPETGMNSLDFMQRAFHFANQSAGNRNYFEDVFGPKSARFSGAEKYLGNVNPSINNEEYEKLKETVQALDEFKETLKNVSFSIVRFFMAGNILNDEGRKRLEEKQEQYGLEHRNMNSVRDKIISGTATQADKDWMVREIAKQQQQGTGVHFTDALRRAIQESPTAPAPIRTYGPPVPQKPKEDEDLKNLHEQIAKEESDARLGLNASARGLMTIGDRRASISSDIGAVDKQIAAIQGKLNSQTLGLSKESFGKMTDVEKDELKHKLTMDLIGEQSKKNSLRADLKEKPLSFDADNLSKAGLYSASALSFNPVLGIAQQQLAELKGIRQAVSKQPSVRGPQRNSFGDMIHNH